MTVSGGIADVHQPVGRHGRDHLAPVHQLSGPDRGDLQQHRVSPAAASQLVIHTQPSPTATAGVAFGTQPVIYVEDQYGNLETGDNSTQVTAASLPVGSGPLQGTTTVTASGGIATFTNLADDKAETITLHFTSSSGLTAATSSNIVISPAAASQLAIDTQPSPTATAGVAFATQPVVYVEDQFGNLVTGDNTHAGDGRVTAR